ncbi:MAG: hypothetical protein M3Q30_05860 [Actinomycetota bacterium]|nr:hypothetical protein [Actinomycetota bacterium]
MPTYDGATISILYRSYGSPVGSVEYVERFVDGKLTGYESGPDPSAELEVITAYATILRYRLGHFTMLEALHRSKVRGAEPALDIAAALIESVPYTNHLGGSDAAWMHSVHTLSGHYASPAWHAAQQRALHEPDR